MIVAVAAEGYGICQKGVAKKMLMSARKKRPRQTNIESNDDYRVPPMACVLCVRGLRLCVLFACPVRVPATLRLLP